MIRMECATATSARLAPLLAAKRRYCVARYVCLACVAAQAASTRVALSQGLPGPMWLLRRLPALSSLLGHTRAQEARCDPVGKRLTSVPISARIACATRGP